jgi:hypothetical protein
MNDWRKKELEEIRQVGRKKIIAIMKDKEVAEKVRVRMRRFPSFMVYARAAQKSPMENYKHPVEDAIGMSSGGLTMHPGEVAASLGLNEKQKKQLMTKAVEEVNFQRTYVSLFYMSK